jgi:oxaloacetate decarboxylase (Na+ extruding) subunit gamma
MSELISSGVELMLVGMGIVYLFLTMLVIAINMISAIVRRLFPELPAKTFTLNPGNSGTDKLTVAAVSAAVHQYRNKRKQQD